MTTTTIFTISADFDGKVGEVNNLYHSRHFDTKIHFNEIEKKFSKIKKKLLKAFSIKESRIVLRFLSFHERRESENGRINGQVRVISNKITTTCGVR